VVDRVEEVCVATDDQISEPPSFGLEIDANYIEKMIRLPSGVVMILNLNAIFSDDELSDLTSVN
jgi:purine-binding chemotaxis protein CheW